MSTENSTEQFVALIKLPIISALVSVNGEVHKEILDEVLKNELLNIDSAAFGGYSINGNIAYISKEQAEIIAQTIVNIDASEYIDESDPAPAP